MIGPGSPVRQTSAELPPAPRPDGQPEAEQIHTGGQLVTAQRSGWVRRADLLDGEERRVLSGPVGEVLTHVEVAGVRAGGHPVGRPRRSLGRDHDLDAAVRGAPQIVTGQSGERSPTGEVPVGEMAGVHLQLQLARRARVSPDHVGRIRCQAAEPVARVRIVEPPRTPVLDQRADLRIRRVVVLDTHGDAGREEAQQVPETLRPVQRRVGHLGPDDQLLQRRDVAGELVPDLTGVNPWLLGHQRSSNRGGRRSAKARPPSTVSAMPISSAPVGDRAPARHPASPTRRAGSAP